MQKSVRKVDTRSGYRLAPTMDVKSSKSHVYAAKEGRRFLITLRHSESDEETQGLLENIVDV